MLAEAPIRLFVMGANTWRDEQEWPLARAVATPWYLHAGGVLSPEQPGDEEPDRYAYDPADPVPTRGGRLQMGPAYPAGPFDQRPIEERPDVLVYTSAPLEHDMEVTGPLTVHLWAISSAPDTDFVARLTDVFPDGRSFNLSDGIVRARYRDFASGAPATLDRTGAALRVRDRPVGHEQRLPGRPLHQAADHLQLLPPLGPQSQHRPSLRRRRRDAGGPPADLARRRASLPYRSAGGRRAGGGVIVPVSLLGSLPRYTQNSTHIYPQDDGAVERREQTGWST